MCSGIFVPLREPAWSEDSLIQSMFPADRQLVCNSSVISSWVMDFSGLATCWVWGWNSICMVWWEQTPNEGYGWQSHCGVFFLEQALQSWSVPEKSRLCAFPLQICSPFAWITYFSLANCLASLVWLYVIVFRLLHQKDPLCYTHYLLFYFPLSLHIAQCSGSSSLCFSSLPLSLHYKHHYSY